MLMRFEFLILERVGSVQTFEPVNPHLCAKRTLNTFSVKVLLRRIAFVDLFLGQVVIDQYV